MRFESLRVANLRAVREFSVQDLKDFVVIAGPNGCGKSCVFDAIRLLKSLYGGYSAGEHMHWFNELGITPQNRMAMRNIYRDPTAPVTIEAVITFSDDEKEFMLEEADELIWPIAWQQATGQVVDHWSFSRISVAHQVAQFSAVVKPQIEAVKAKLSQEFEQESLTISLTITPDGEMSVAPCSAAQVSFGAFEPESLGIIEYHSAARSYTRQPLQGINLDSRAFEDQRRQQTLYNAQAKYQNVKTELASGYLRALIKQSAGGDASNDEDLNETLKELFQTFFPDKTYLGVQALERGSLDFPVVLPGGERHDIDDLSSGEKEILYGYLRLRNSTPKHSVILLDEPELHLNPSLLQGFTDFYYRHLGVARGNQLWLVTHSDVLLRQAIGNSNYRVYHMQTATSSTGGNQASEVLLDSDVDRVTVDLVGDLAAYRPHAKVVILEGANADAFDETFIRRLFPEFARRVNLVSGGSKQRVKDLWEVLHLSAEQSGIHNRFFAIVDRDTDKDPSQIPSSTFTWNCYHIENYLLEAHSVRLAAYILSGSELFESDEAVDEALRACAGELTEDLVLHRLRAEVNREIVEKIDVGGKATKDGVGLALLGSLIGSSQRVSAYASQMTAKALDARASAVRLEYTEALTSDDWRRVFPGREILKRFAVRHLDNIKYETFRNVIVDKMQQSELKPGGMRVVLDEILRAE